MTHRAATPLNEAELNRLVPNLATSVLQLAQVLISPKMALQWLEDKAPNRQIRQRAVEKYARDIKSGHWLLNGETIKFDRLGRLLDGQHRLWAVVEADIAQEFTVALGLDPDAMATVDTGLVRTFADVLTINGGYNTRQVAAVLRMVWDYEQGTPGVKNVHPTHTDLGAILSRFPDIPLWVSEHRGKSLEKLGQFSPMMFVSYMANRVNSDKAQSFVAQIGSGTDLADDSATFQLRERMLSWRMTGGGGSKKLNGSVVLAAMIKAWQAHLSDRPVRVLRWSSTEDFPRFDPHPKGLRRPATMRLIRDREA